MFTKMINILKENPRKIVFPEGSDPRILEASARLLADGILTPILVGDAAEIEAAQAETEAAQTEETAAAQAETEAAQPETESGAETETSAEEPEAGGTWLSGIG